MVCDVPGIRVSRIAWAGQDQERSAEGRSAMVRADGVRATAADSCTWEGNLAVWAEPWAVVRPQKAAPTMHLVTFSLTQGQSAWSLATGGSEDVTRPTTPSP